MRYPGGFCIGNKKVSETNCPGCSNENNAEKKGILTQALNITISYADKTLEMSFAPVAECMI